MSVGVLILAHAPIGSALLGAARQIVGSVPAQFRTIEFDHGPSAESTRAQAARCLYDLDSGDGVLVLTDLFGATPANIAVGLGDQGVTYRWLAGINLPMLLRVINYAELPLTELYAVAENGGHGGVVNDHARA